MLTASKIKKIPRSFYNRSTLEVLDDIIGKIVVCHTAEGRMSARIVEAEAYIGEDDPACHAASGKTERNKIMYGEAGHAYIYFIYGMYNCLNFVTEGPGKPAAILLRACEPIEGIDIMNVNSPGKSKKDLLNGPGKFCRSFGLSRDQNGLDLCGDRLFLIDDSYKPSKIVTSQRIGIKQAKELLWRYYDASSDCVSRK